MFCYWIPHPVICSASVPASMTDRDVAQLNSLAVLTKPIITSNTATSYIHVRKGLKGPLTPLPPRTKSLINISRFLLLAFPELSLLIKETFDVFRRFQNQS